jgi:hypothetical protein
MNTLDTVLSSQFYNRSIHINKEIKEWDLKSVLFPLKKFITEGKGKIYLGDEFFKHLWKAIDKSKDYAWIISYAFDHSIPANTTIIKLIEARKRGVNTVIFVDDLQQHIDKDLLNQYVAAGGVFQSLNPFFSTNTLKNLFSK